MTGPAAATIAADGRLRSASVTATPEPPPRSPVRDRAPAPLVVAASLVAVEAMLLVIQGVAQIVSVSGDRAAMGVTTSVFFVLYGAGLAFCALMVTRLSSWARAPIVVSQLILLLLAWSFRGGDTTAVAITFALVAVLVLLGVFHPASLDALADEDSPRRRRQQH